MKKLIFKKGDVIIYNDNCYKDNTKWKLIEGGLPLSKLMSQESLTLDIKNPASMHGPTWRLIDPTKDDGYGKNSLFILDLKYMWLKRRVCENLIIQINLRLEYELFNPNNSFYIVSIRASAAGKKGGV